MESSILRGYDNKMLTKVANIIGSGEVIKCSKVKVTKDQIEIFIVLRMIINKVCVVLYFCFGTCDIFKNV